MKVARVRKQSQPRLTSPFGVGGTTPMPALDDLSDVDLTGLADGDSIVYDSGTSTWVPGTGGGGGGGGGGQGIGAKATNTAGTSLSNNTPTAMPLATEEFDTDGFHDNSTNNSRMTIPTGLGGKYLVTGQYTIGSAFSASSIYALIRKNGSSDHAFSRTANDTSASTGRNISVPLELVAGDYVELIVNQNSGVAKTLETTAGYNWLSIMRFDSTVQPGTLLACNSASVAITGSTVTSLTDVDGTNLAPTITVPSTGNVLVVLSALIGTVTQDHYWGLRDGSNATLQAGNIVLRFNSYGYEYVTVQYRLTGLTPAASLQIKWGYYSGGGAGGNVTFLNNQPSVMSVYAAP